MTEQPPTAPAVLTVLAVHPIIPRRALADVVGENVPAVRDHLALAVVVARIGVAGAWARGKMAVTWARVENKSISGVSLPRHLTSHSGHGGHCSLACVAISRTGPHAQQYRAMIRAHCKAPGLHGA